MATKDNLRTRFDYNQSKSNEMLMKKRKELERFMNRKEKHNKHVNNESCYRFVRNTITVLVVILAIIYTWFTHYPEPAISPFLHGWQEMGKQFIYRSQYDIFYIDKMTNKTNGPTLLYLHGFPTSNVDMYKILPQLTNHFGRIIAPDFIGFGFSSKPKSYQYSIKDQAELIQSLLDHLNIDNVHILSHDYGDSVAQHLLSLNKKKSLKFQINSVCMMNGGIFPSHHRPVLFQRILRMPIIGSVASRLLNRYLFYIAITKVFGHKNPPTIPELYDMWKLIRLNDGYLVLGPLLSYIDERFENENEWIDAISDSRPVPLHFIYGPADPVNPPPFDEFYRNIINQPNIKVLDTNIGHYPQMEAPDDVIESYVEFLNKNNFL
ncbi:mesoderm-specific transcript protein-like protein [Dermatophagoides farinae]|uniref:Mesoderm-specific transcript protein-like protein n=1 Tax=Dermatophagoides farinae TaxID=6954 RepID=A0A9D4SJY8_DERFA|nr:mesoderm-specific transcript protein-like [Dermatophagoides farinae]KAH7644573.1 mesoderm-specific transcript protein-like protein [Dermatophagoides farinae]